MPISEEGNVFKFVFSNGKFIELKMSGSEATLGVNGTSAMNINSLNGKVEIDSFTSPALSAVAGGTGVTDLADVTSIGKAGATLECKSTLKVDVITYDIKTVNDGDLDIFGKVQISGAIVGDLSGSVKTTAQNGTVSTVLDPKLNSDDSAVFTGDLSGLIKTTNHAGDATSTVFDPKINSDNHAEFKTVIKFRSIEIMILKDILSDFILAIEM